MSAKKAGSSSGLPLCDALASMDRPRLTDYCAAAAEYIRTASTSTASQQKIAQVQLSNSLAAITLADIRERAIGQSRRCRVRRPLRVEARDVAWLDGDRHLESVAAGRVGHRPIIARAGCLRHRSISIPSDRPGSGGRVCIGSPRPAAQLLSGAANASASARSMESAPSRTLAT